MSTLNIYLPKRTHTEIIGKGGATIKKLSTDFNVSIKVPNKDDPSCMVTILGSPDNASKARLEIEKLIGFKASDEPLVTVHLDVSPSYHGLIIGKAGATLKDLEHKSNGTSIQIPKKDDEDNKHITLEGSKEGTAKAKQLIEQLIGHKVNVVDTSVAKVEQLFAKLDLSSKPINESLFFPDADPATLHNFERFLAYLRSATKSLDICVFTITDDRISMIIEDAFRSGAKVRIITDDECMQQVGSDVKRLASIGIDTKSDNNKKAHMHHKFVIVDGTLLINGSFNWTRQASLENCENVMVTNNKEFIAAFSKQFEAMWKDKEHFVIVK